MPVQALAEHREGKVHGGEICGAQTSLLGNPDDAGILALAQEPDRGLVELEPVFHACTKLRDFT